MARTMSSKQGQLIAVIGDEVSGRGAAPATHDVP